MLSHIALFMLLTADPGPWIPTALEAYRSGYVAQAEGRYADALQAFDTYQATLAISPNRFNSVAGAAWAADKLGDEATALQFYTRLLEIAGEGKTSRPGLDRARSYLMAHSLGREEERK